MGFVNSASTVSLSAKLTQVGRGLILTGVSSVGYFSLGDSDTNYKMSVDLSAGSIPDVTGDYQGCVKSVADGVQLRHNIKVYDVDNKVYGCTSPNAINYNDQATVDDGSCKFKDADTGEQLTFYCKAGTNCKQVKFGLGDFSGGTGFEGTWKQKDKLPNSTAEYSKLSVDINLDEYAKYMLAMREKFDLNTSPQNAFGDGTFGGFPQTLLDTARTLGVKKPPYVDIYDYVFIEETLQNDTNNVTLKHKFFDDIRFEFDDEESSQIFRILSNPYIEDGEKAYGFYDESILTTEVPVQGTTYTSLKEESFSPSPLVMTVSGLNVKDVPTTATTKSSRIHGAGPFGLILHGRNYGYKVGDSVRQESLNASTAYPDGQHEYSMGLTSYVNTYGESGKFAAISSDNNVSEKPQLEEFYLPGQVENQTFSDCLNLVPAARLINDYGKYEAEVNKPIVGKQYEFQPSYFAAEMKVGSGSNAKYPGLINSEHLTDVLGAYDHIIRYSKKVKNEVTSAFLGKNTYQNILEMEYAYFNQWWNKTFNSYTSISLNKSLKGNITYDAANDSHIVSMNFTAKAKGAHSTAKPAKLTINLISSNSNKIFSDKDNYYLDASDKISAGSSNFINMSTGALKNVNNIVTRR